MEILVVPKPLILKKLFSLINISVILVILLHEFILNQCFSIRNEIDFSTFPNLTLSDNADN